MELIRYEVGQSSPILQSLVYTGTRNGSIERFDMRMPTDRSQKLFDDRFKCVPRSSVLHLSVIRDRELLISHLNGDVGFFFFFFLSLTTES
jgi:WD repeat-containing protein 21A